MSRRRLTRRAFLAGATGLVAGAGLATRTRASSASMTRTEVFDYIIVGAGSAGCVLAHRLSARRDVRVLLLEAGGPGDDPRIRTPGRWVSLLGGELDWNYATEPQAGLENRTVAWPRGKVLGGSSAINAMVYVRGHRADYDRWSAAGNTGWGFDAVLPYFTRSEDNSRGASAFHGAGGPLAVSDTTDPSAAHEAFLDAARSLGYDARPDWDFNGLRQEDAAGFYQKNIRHGARHSAAAAFLDPVRGRTNLTIRPWTQATRLLWQRRRAAGVEYLRDGRPEQAFAEREVVLAAGVIESPKLLMLSGVGPADALRRLGIDPVADLPGVGRHLEDHLKVTVVHHATREIPASTVSAGLFVRSRADLAGAAPDLQFYFGRGVDEPSPMLSVTVALERPASHGTIDLRSANPLDAPRVDPRYLEAAADVDALVAGVTLARALARARAFDPWRGDEVEPGPTVLSRPALAGFVRRAADTIFHPVGTCRMGPGGDAVVDPRLRVHGVEGVRVADASIVPRIVNGNTHAACVMIGEKAADLIAGADDPGTGVAAADRPASRPDAAGRSAGRGARGLDRSGR